MGNVQVIVSICGLLVVITQVVNVFLYLSIKVAILQSEASIKDWASKEFVSKELCKYRGQLENPDRRSVFECEG